jgi:type II secretory pathway pseudopilin PulG
VKRAFTLVEALVAISIVVILIGLIFIIVGPGMARAKTTPNCTSNLKQIGLAYNLYLSENDGGLPIGQSLLRDPARKDLAALVNCPLTKTRYWDNVEEFLAGDKIFTRTFPDGSPIPSFDAERDVLYRCLDHAYDGYSRIFPPGQGRMETPETRGKVLGVRLSGSVTKVAPMSCWEFRLRYPDAASNLPYLWEHCDRGD